MNVAQVLYRNALAFPDKEAVVDERGSRLTWGELNENANRLGNALLQTGLRKGDRLGIMLENDCSYLITLLGAAKAGVITAGINSKLGREQVAKLIDNSSPKALIVRDKFSDIVEDLKGDMESVETVIGYGNGHGFSHDYHRLMAESTSQAPKVQVGDDDIFILLYTSGTTSLPKGAVITHRCMFMRMMMLYMGFRLGRDEVLLNGFPLFGGAGMMMAMGALFSGCKLVLHVVKGKSWVELIEREKVTAHLMNATRLKLVTDYLAESERGYDLSSIRKVEIGGMGLSASQFRHIAEYFHVSGNGLYSWYGSSEASVPVSILTPEEIIPALKAPQGGSLERRLESMGRATPFVALRVVDEDGRDIEPGETGEIIMRGDTLMKGYWERPDANEKAFRDGWYLSNDFATRDPDGFLYFAGRKDSLIRSAGYFVRPTEVERVIAGHGAIEEVAVFGVPHKTWGEVVTAVCSLKPGQEVDEDGLKQYCKENMGRYEVPRAIHIIDSLPKDPQSTKILVRELRSRFTPKGGLGE